MSSAIATCVAGPKPARSIASHSVVERLLVGREIRPPAAFVGDAGSGPRSAISAPAAR